MQLWYEEVRFHHAISCDACGHLLTRRGSVSLVFDMSGNPVEVADFNGDCDGRADYVLPCRCGQRLDVQSPEDVERLRSTTSGPAPTAPPVIKLT